MSLEQKEKEMLDIMNTIVSVINTGSDMMTKDERNQLYIASEAFYQLIDSLRYRIKYGIRELEISK